MSKYAGLEYEKKVDCFARFVHVKSTLIYGDINAIEKPWLTVIVPTYKRADLLEEAITSLLIQFHTDFYWDIVVVDNEPYDGKGNETEKLIKKIDNPRILYYRNSENLPPGDNFNRGIMLARGEWVSILHDDDLLVSNTLQNLGKIIQLYEKKTIKPLAAISAKYYQFEYDPKKELMKADVWGINQYLVSLPTDYKLYKLTHNNILATAHIGGFAPTNGTTYSRKAVLKMGGFNEDYGIFADLILFYCLENDYSIYLTNTPLGFYRWGCNLSMKQETTYKLIKENCSFREYVYSKNMFSKLVGMVLRNSHYKRFALDVIREKNNVSRDKVSLKEFDTIFSKRPSKLMYFLYTSVILHLYSIYKRMQSKFQARGMK